MAMHDTRLFLVRVWPHHGGFRASVRGVDDAEPRLFTEPAQLGEFLRAAGALGGTPPTPPAKGERDEDPA